MKVTVATAAAAAAAALTSIQAAATATKRRRAVKAKAMWSWRWGRRRRGGRGGGQRGGAEAEAAEAGAAAADENVDGECARTLRGGESERAIELAFVGDREADAAQGGADVGSVSSVPVNDVAMSVCKVDDAGARSPRCH